MNSGPSFAFKNGVDALADTRNNRMSKYPDREDRRFDGFLFLPFVESSFRIGIGSSVFTIGSCFARNIEAALIARGVSVPTAHFSAAQDKVPGRANRVLNQYNPGTMLQCVEDVMGKPTVGGIYPANTRGEVVDCLLATGGSAVSEARATERRSQVSRLYREGLAKSDTVVITLGLIETWIDREADIYLNETPPRKMIVDHPDRFEFRRLDVAECEGLVSRMVDLLIKDRPRNIVLTVSPVPLQRTFSGDDAITANGYSKAVLRVVAELISNKFDMVDYVPSYETVTTAGFRGYSPDNVHVRPVVVQRIVNNMLDHYLEGAGAA